MYTDVAYISVCVCVRVKFWFSRPSRGLRCVRHVSNENCFTFSKKLASNINFSEINLPIFLLPSPLPLSVFSHSCFFFVSPIPVCRALKAAARAKTRLIQATPLPASMCVCVFVRALARSSLLTSFVMRLAESVGKPILFSNRIRFLLKSCLLPNVNGIPCSFDHPFSLSLSVSLTHLLSLLLTVCLAWSGIRTRNSSRSQLPLLQRAQWQRRLPPNVCTWTSCGPHFLFHNAALSL